MKHLIIALLLINSASGAPLKESSLKAIYVAAKTYNVDAQDLVRIAFLESSFNEHAKRVNKNNTIDFGLFQINSVHWSTTCKQYDIFKVTGNTLCAAKLLAQAKKHATTDKHWKGRYHSKTPSKKQLYATKIELALR